MRNDLLEGAKGSVAADAEAFEAASGSLGCLPMALQRAPGGLK